jgi:glycosyltransferase involved in cell wall biosynthesis
MRILMASRGVLPIRPGCGGAEMVAFQLAKAIAAEGHEVSLVADVDPETPVQIPGLEIIPVGSRMQRLVLRLPGGFFKWILQHLIGNAAAARRVREVLRKRGLVYDAIHTHGGLSTILVSRRGAGPLIYTEHDATPWSCRYRRWYERAIRKAIYRLVNVTAFKRADKVLTTFETQAREIVERWSLPPEKVATIGNGADFDVFNPVRDGTNGARSELGFDRYCLFVGSLIPRKSPDLLLEAVAEAGAVPCVFAGDGPMRRQLERRAAELGIQEKVRFLGDVPSSVLGRLYADSDMLVLPSVSEGSPLVVVEAMASEVPVLATRIAGLPSMIEDWETGFLVKPGDVGQLAMGIRFLAGDADLRRRMGANGRRRALRDYPWPLIAWLHVLLYQSVRIRLARADWHPELPEETSPVRALTQVAPPSRVPEVPLSA